MVPIIQLGFPSGGNFSPPLLIAGIIVYIFPLIAAIWVFSDANSRDRNGILWALGTIILGPFGFITLIVYFTSIYPRDEIYRPLRSGED